MSDATQNLKIATGSRNHFGRHTTLLVPEQQSSGGGPYNSLSISNPAASSSPSRKTVKFGSAEIGNTGFADVARKALRGNMPKFKTMDHHGKKKSPGRGNDKKTKKNKNSEEQE